VVAIALALPTLALTGCGNNSNAGGGGGGGYTAPAPMAQPQKQGMTGKQKVVLLAGAALLYYMYKRYQKQNAASATGANGKPQLYRSKNGGVYYRDPRTHQPTWVTAPQQSMSVDQSELQQYAPDYQQYQGQPAPPAPQGYRTQSFDQLDPSMGGGAMAPAGPRGPRGPGM